MGFWGCFLSKNDTVAVKGSHGHIFVAVTQWKTPNNEK